MHPVRAARDDAADARWACACTRRQSAAANAVIAGRATGRHFGLPALSDRRRRGHARRRPWRGSTTGKRAADDRTRILLASALREPDRAALIRGAVRRSRARRRPATGGFRQPLRPACAFHRRSTLRASRPVPGSPRPVCRRRHRACAGRAAGHGRRGRSGRWRSVRCRRDPGRSALTRPAAQALSAVSTCVDRCRIGRTPGPRRQCAPCIAGRACTRPSHALTCGWASTGAPI